MREVFNNLIRRVLALTIRCPKHPRTKGDVLRYALRLYLTNLRYGLCWAINKATVHFQYERFIIKDDYENLPLVFPLFRYEIAVKMFNGNGLRCLYWWPIEDWKSRYRYMKWLIKQYDNEEL